jgi:uncharacterized membrane protein
MNYILQNILLSLLYLLIPALVIHYAGKFFLIRKAGNVAVVYLLGLILGNTGLIDNHFYQIQELFSNVIILIALPVLLSGMDYSSGFKMAPKTFISMLLGVLSVFVVVFLGFFLFNRITQDSWQISGLLVGLYTGGTPNLAALKVAIQVPAHTYIMVHASDIIFTGAYLFLMMSVGKLIIKKWLPFGYMYRGKFTNRAFEFTHNEDYSYFFASYNFWPTMGLLGIAISIFAIGAGVMLFVPEKYGTLLEILIITTLGIGLSFIPQLRRTPKSFELGMYLILVFSFVVASMVDFSQLSRVAMPIFLYVSYTITASLLLHILLARLFKLDADTVIITSTALICSPPFVPIVAGSLNNRALIISGLSVGIIGYAVGNYLGIIMALILKP